MAWVEKRDGSLLFVISTPGTEPRDLADGRGRHNSHPRLRSQPNADSPFLHKSPASNAPPPISPSTPANKVSYTQLIQSATAIMHSAAAFASTSAVFAVARCSSSSTNTVASNTSAHSHSHSDSSESSCVLHSAPQCCHCGWRGAHSPNCPFR